MGTTQEQDPGQTDTGWVEDIHHDEIDTRINHGGMYPVCEVERTPGHQFFHGESVRIGRVAIEVASNGVARFHGTLLPYQTPANY